MSHFCGGVSAVLVLVHLCFAAQSAYRFVDNVVTVEAEDLEYSSQFWEKKTAFQGFKGSGYIEYKGGSFGNEYDPTGTQHGSEASWVKVPVYVEKPGNYMLNVLTYCTGGEAGIAVWTHVMGYNATVNQAHGAFDTHPQKWWWLSHGPGMIREDGTVQTIHHSFILRDVPKVYTFYIAGRFTGFKADRIQIYPTTGPNQYPVNHTNVNAPLSQLVDIEASVAAKSLHVGHALGESALITQWSGMVSVKGATGATLFLVNGARRELTPCGEGRFTLPDGHAAGVYLLQTRDRAGAVSVHRLRYR